MGLKSQDPYYMSPLKNLSEQCKTESVYSSKNSSVSIVALIHQIGLHSFKAQLSWGLGNLWWGSRMMPGRADQAEKCTVAPDPRELLGFCERLCAVIRKVLHRSASFAHPSLLSPVIWKKELVLRCRWELERLYEYTTHLWDKAGAHETTGLWWQFVTKWPLFLSTSVL